jgi:hypothetical protein
MTRSGSGPGPSGPGRTGTDPDQIRTKTRIRTKNRIDRVHLHRIIRIVIHRSSEDQTRFGTAGSARTEVSKIKLLEFSEIDAHYQVQGNMERFQW